MSALFYLFCTTLPNHIIPFALFWRFPWRSRGAAMALICCNVLCKMAIAAYCLENGASFRGLELLFGLVGLLIYGFYLRVDFYKQLFVYILIVDYLLVVRGIASFGAVCLCGSSSQGWISSVACILLYSLSLPALIRLSCPIIGRIGRMDVPRLWRIIWLIPGLLTVLTLVSTNAYLDDSAGSAFFLLCRIGLLVCAVTICLMLFAMMESLQRQIVLEQRMVLEKKMMDMQMEEQKKHNLLIMENAEQTRQMRHDLRHQLTAIRAMAGTERFIHLNSVVRHGMLTVTMDNSFDGRVQMEDGKYRSSKRDALGIGLSSIQAVAKSHQGDARFEAKDRVFSSSVYAQIQEDGAKTEAALQNPSGNSDAAVRRAPLQAGRLPRT